MLSIQVLDEPEFFARLIVKLSNFRRTMWPSPVAIESNRIGHSWNTWLPRRNERKLNPPPANQAAKRMSTPSERKPMATRVCANFSAAKELTWLRWLLLACLYLPALPSVLKYAPISTIIIVATLPPLKRKSPVL